MLEPRNGFRKIERMRERESKRGRQKINGPRGLRTKNEPKFSWMKKVSPFFSFFSFFLSRVISSDSERTDIRV